MRSHPVLFGFVAALLLSGLSVAESAEIEEGTCEVFRTTQVLLSSVVFLLIVVAAVVYAGSRIFGSESRSKADVWVTSMIAGAIMGVVIYLILPFAMGAMLPEGSPAIEEICVEEGSGVPSPPSEPGPGVPPEEEPVVPPSSPDEPSPPVPPEEEPIVPDEPSPPLPPEESECSSHSDCAAGGTCSFECMLAEDVGNISEQCPGVPESVCYQYTSCGCYGGQCSWEQTPEFQECLDDPPPNPTRPECIIDADCVVTGCLSDSGTCVPADMVDEIEASCEYWGGLIPPGEVCGCNAGKCSWEHSPGPGECLVDSDCATAGCSSQLCVPAGEAGGIITTCEYNDWYACLQYSSCGCNMGSCAWDQNQEYLDCLESPPPP